MSVIVGETGHTSADLFKIDPAAQTCEKGRVFREKRDGRVGCLRLEATRETKVAAKAEVMLNE